MKPARTLSLFAFDRTVCERVVRTAVLVGASLLLASCALETTRREGISLIMEGRYEEGLARLEQLSLANPKDTEARSTFLRQREQAVNRLLNAARNEQVNERFDAAEALYRRALAVEPGNAAAKSGLADVAADRRHAKWLSDAQAMFKKGDAAGAKTAVNLILLERPTHVAANQLRYQLEEAALKDNLAGPRLNIKGRKPVTLQFRDANLKMVLEAISRTTGVNIMIDKDVRNDIKVSIFVKDTPVEETLDLILLQNQLEKRVLGENTVLVYPFTPAKSKDYQELKVRRFALVNADPKQAQSMIKTILKTKDVYVDERSNAVVIRDTAQVIRLAEKLVAAMDQPEPEVMLEVELLDIDRSRALDLGIDWPTSVTASLPAGTIADFKNRNNSTTNLSALSVTAKAKGSDSDSRTLATPRIRVRNKEKAKIMIGNRTPVISSAAVPGTSAGAVAVFNTNIQYLETGIKLEVEPTIYLDGNVAIKLNLEVSDIVGDAIGTASGSVAFKTTTNNASTVLRLKDGETQVLGGLLRAFDSHGQSNKIPGLGDIPFLGRLFGVGSDSWQNRELVLAITPRIVRNNQVSEADLVELWSGTESNVKYFAPDLRIPATSAVSSQGGTPAAARALPAAAARSSPPPLPGAARSLSIAPATGALSVAIAGPSQARVGDKFSVSVNADGGAAVNSLVFTLNYDSAMLKALAVNEGELTRRPGVRASFDGQIEESAGKVVAVIAAEAGGATGNGLVASVQFEVIGGVGPAQVSVSGVTATSAAGDPMQVASPQALMVEIQGN